MSAAAPEAAGRLLVLMFAAFACTTIIFTAWLSDDAMITARTSMNLVEGRGLTWNPGERVQAYTNPLWMFLIAAAYAICGDINVAVLSLSMVTSFGVVALYAARSPTGPLAAVLGLAILGMSKAFIDFSTSGLENPLTHLFMLGFYSMLLRGSRSTGAVFAMALLAGLCCLNRMDTILLSFPGLMLVWWERGAREPAIQHATRERAPLHPGELPDSLTLGVRMVAGRRLVGTTLLIGCGLLPVALWMAFATVYYGFPFPNTAYAKLNNGADAARMLQQGWFYLLNSFRLDPLTPMVIVAGMLSPIALRTRPAWAIGIGAWLYMAYVMRIGGDFMSGRMLAAPLLACVVLLTSVIKLPPASALPALAVVLVVGLSNPWTPLNKLDDYFSGITLIDPHGIADERFVYSPHTRLVDAPMRGTLVTHPYIKQGVEYRAQSEVRGGTVAIECGTLGFIGTTCGPRVFLMDEHGLADVLLARMPVRAGSEWRIGHFSRVIPDGYEESIESGENRLTNPRVRKMLDQVWLISRGELFSMERLLAIIEANQRGL